MIDDPGDAEPDAIIIAASDADAMVPWQEGEDPGIKVSSL